MPARIIEAVLVTILAACIFGPLARVMLLFPENGNDLFAAVTIWSLAALVGAAHLWRRTRNSKPRDSRQ